jgi:flagellar hook assembly protein FlgD
MVFASDMEGYLTVLQFTETNTSVFVGGPEQIPNKVVLHQNYPNPFNPSTQISYNLPEDAMVNINVYDLMGRSVRTLVSSNQIAGYRSVRWDATNDVGELVSAGMYVYLVRAGDYSQTKKMVLLK